MSRTTLYRNLAERNLTFKGIVDDMRKQSSLKYLNESTLSLGEICDLLGYANQSAFNRSFKRWFASTPSDYRKRGTYN